MRAHVIPEGMDAEIGLEALAREAGDREVPAEMRTRGMEAGCKP